MNKQMDLTMITPKEKARLLQLFKKTINNPNLTSETYNRIQSSILSQDLKQKTIKTNINRNNVLNAYAEKFNLPRTIQKYIDGCSVKTEFKYHLDTLLKDSQN